MSSDYCTLKELSRAKSFRDVIECWKRNILSCRDVSDEFRGSRLGRRYIEVEFINLNGEHGETIIVYEPGAEKEKLHPLVLAAYEKCLGIKTVF